MGKPGARKTALGKPEKAYALGARSAPEFLRRVALLVLRRARALRARGRIPPVRPWGGSLGAVAAGRQITIRLATRYGGLQGAELASSGDAALLSRALRDVAVAIGRGYWTNRRYQKKNLASRFRYFYGIRYYREKGDDRVTPSQGANLNHWLARGTKTTLESVSDWDSDPAGSGKSTRGGFVRVFDGWRPGAARRWDGFALASGEKNADRFVKYVRLYLFIAAPWDTTYRASDERRKRILAGRNKRASVQKTKRK